MSRSLYHAVLCRLFDPHRMFVDHLPQAHVTNPELDYDTVSSGDDLVCSDHPRCDALLELDRTVKVTRG